MLAASVVAPAFAGVMGGTVAARFARVHVPTRVILRYGCSGVLAGFLLSRAGS